MQHAFCIHTVLRVYLSTRLSVQSFVWTEFSQDLFRIEAPIVDSDGGFCEANEGRLYN